MKNILLILTLFIIPYFVFAQNTNNNQPATQVSAVTSAIQDIQSVSQDTYAETTISDVKNADSEKKVSTLFWIIFAVLLYPLWKIFKIFMPIFRAMSSCIDGGGTSFPALLVSFGSWILFILAVFFSDLYLSGIIEVAFAGK